MNGNDKKNQGTVQNWPYNIVNKWRDIHFFAYYKKIKKLKNEKKSILFLKINYEKTTNYGR